MRSNATRSGRACGARARLLPAIAAGERVAGDALVSPAEHVLLRAGAGPRAGDQMGGVLRLARAARESQPPRLSMRLTRHTSSTRIISAPRGHRHGRPALSVTEELHINKTAWAQTRAAYTDSADPYGAV